MTLQDQFLKTPTLKKSSNKGRFKLLEAVVRKQICYNKGSFRAYKGGAKRCQTS